MSKEQDYFPPSGSKYKWEPKSLSYAAWYCDLSKQLHKQMQDDKLLIFPMCIVAYVNLKDGQYNWTVDIIDWSCKQTTKSGHSTNALRALRAAEKVGEKVFNDLTPDWIITALKNKWRPPSASF